MRTPSKFTKILLASTTTLLLLACQDTESEVETTAPVSDDVAVQTTTPTPQRADVSDTIITADMAEAEKAALELFAYQEGEWESEWIFFDATGAQTGVMTGTQIFAYLVDEHSQLMTNLIPAVNHTSYSLRGYNANDGQIVSLNMGADGDYWALRQDPLTGISVSELHKNADGTLTIRRFSRSTLGENGYNVYMEVSLDKGETWFKRFEQKLKRKQEE